MIFNNIKEFQISLLLKSNIIAIDFGLKKIAIAIGDNEIKIAMPFALIEINNKQKKIALKYYKNDSKNNKLFKIDNQNNINDVVANIILLLLNEENITGIIFGLSKTLNNELHLINNEIFDIINKILAIKVLSIFLLDERMSTIGAVMNFNYDIYKQSNSFKVNNRTNFRRVKNFFSTKLDYKNFKNIKSNASHIKNGNDDIISAIYLLNLFFNLK